MNKNKCSKCGRLIGKSPHKCPEINPFKNKKHNDETKIKLSNYAKLRKGEKSNSWKGGKYKLNGYIMKLSPYHPHCDRYGYVCEHRLIMEKHLGRVLLPTEVVHHINEDKKDNRIENLMLFSNNQEHLKFHREMKHG